MNFSIFGVFSELAKLKDFVFKKSKEPTKLKISRLHPNAMLPKYANIGDAGMDLTAVTKEWDEANSVFTYGFGLALEIPNGYVGLVFPRSSIYKTPMSLSNCVGVIDSSYRGEIKAMFKTSNKDAKNYEVGDRICQMIILPYPAIVVEEVAALTVTARGLKGFGSSGLISGK
jgi:dUTP pyrophosphatase